MDRLRARHWLAATAAFALIVVGFVYSPNRNQATTTVEVDLLALASDLAADREPGDSSVDTGTEASDADDRSADIAPPADVDGPRAPLTGLVVDEADLDRPALLVKVDNHPRARPQTGLDQADIVFDLRAEGITRFLAVFHSTPPNPVGPVRSSRTSDFDLLRGFDTPLYASSGGNNYVTNGLRALPIVELTNRTRNEYFRDHSRPAPHNLYVNSDDLYPLAPDDLPTLQPWFVYRGADEDLPATAAAAVGPVTVSFTGSPVVSHEWDATVGGWLRTQDGAPHLTVNGDQLAPENVVIMVTDYRTSPADAASPEVISIGGGDAVVLTDGHVITGSWERPEAEDKLTLLDLDGEVIALTPGRTWVLMPEDGQVRFAPGQDRSGSD